jgi:hypothetical protein
LAELAKTGLADIVAMRRRRIEESCGVWKDDESIKVIFEEIQEARRSSVPRDVNLNAPS